jgi:hypothetical protein
MVKTWISLLGGHAFAAVRVFLTQTPIPCMSPDIETSWRTRILSPPAEPLVLVLWLNQVTQQFCGEPLQTPRAGSGSETLPCTSSCS